MEKRRYRGKRLFLLGHSMGSFMVRRTTTVYEDGPDGVILMGTGSQPEGMVFAGWCLASLVSAIRGSRSRSRLLHELSLGNYNRKFWPVQTDHDWLTRDMEKARSFEADPYCQFLFYCRGLPGFFPGDPHGPAGRTAGKDADGHAPSSAFGDRDPVGENERGVRKVYKRFSDAGCRILPWAFIRTPAMSCSMRPTGRRYGRIFFPGFWGHLEEQNS